MVKSLIENVWYSRLRKLEISELVKNVILIVSRHGPAALFIADMYALLVEVQPLLLRLKVPFGSQPLSGELRVMRKTRDNLLGAILKQASSLGRGIVGAYSAQVVLVLPFVRQYLGGIAANNSLIKTEKINQMFIALNENPTLKAALTTVGLKAYFDELKSLQESMFSLVDQRRTLLAARPKMETVELKKEIVMVLTNFFQSVELARFAHLEVDYMPLINEINASLITYNSQIRARDTRKQTALDASLLVAGVAKKATPADQEESTLNLGNEVNALLITYNAQITGGDTRKQTALEASLLAALAKKTATDQESNPNTVAE